MARTIVNFLAQPYFMAYIKIAETHEKLWYLSSLLLISSVESGYSLTLFGDCDSYRSSFPHTFSALGRVAQSVEQRTENPRVGGSIPSPPTTLIPLKLVVCKIFREYLFFKFPCIFQKKL